MLSGFSGEPSELLAVGGKEFLFLFNVTGDLEGPDIAQGGRLYFFARNSVRVWL